MLNYRFLAFVLLLWLTGCAAGTVTADAGKNDKYVEISNPAYTTSPGAPATIWVPRESEENGPQRGSALVSQGIAKVVLRFQTQPAVVGSCRFFQLRCRLAGLVEAAIGVADLAHAVRNSYVAHLGGPEVFSELVWAEARRRGWTRARDFSYPSAAVVTKR